MKHWFTLLFGLLAGPALAQRPPLPAAVAVPDAPAGLAFRPNRGQWHPAARYVAEVPGGRLFMEDTGLTYAFLQLDGPAHGHPAASTPSTRNKQQETRNPRACALKVQFVGALARPDIVPAGPTGEVRNYFRGADPAHWARRVPAFGQLRYAAVWPGIAVRLYENQQQRLEYDFELSAGADPARIALRYAGADAMALDAAGNLQITLPLGRLTELAPAAWQTDAAGRRRPVRCRYVLRQAAGATEIRFALGPHDSARPLTIDPTVVFSTFTGSRADNWGFTATYDQAGNLYSGGIVFGPGYPTTAGAYAPTYQGTEDPMGNALDSDIALIKFNPRASGPAARVWATYLGGSSSEFPHSLVTNRRGELVLLGTTSSPDFPTTAGAYDRRFDGGPLVSPYSRPQVPGQPSSLLGPPYNLPNGSDIVVSRLSAGGDSLLASTFLGGTGTDGLLSIQDAAPRLCHNYGDYFRGDILLDAQDNVYLASATGSANFPRTAGNFGGPAYHGGPTDGVVASLTPRLTALRFSGLLGGSGADAAYSLQLDAQGGVYATGGTTSPDFPVTAGCLQPAPGGDVDAFVARIAPGGGQISRATYLGSAAYDQAYFVQLDGQGAVYLLGQTLAPFAASPGRYTNIGGTQYVQKLSPRLDSLRFRTVFGSGQRDRNGPLAGQFNINLSPTAFLVDECNRVYISGWGGSQNQNGNYGFTNGHTGRMPLTRNAAQATTDSADFYLAQFGPDMSRLQYATYLGNNDGTNGDHVDGGTCRFDPRGFIYHAVCSCGSVGAGFPVPPGANTYTTTKGSFNCNNAAFKINFETVPITSGVDSVVCVTAPPLRLRGRPSGGTWAGPGVSGSPAAGYVFTPAPALLGFQTLLYTVVGDSVCGTSAPLRLRVAPAPVAAFTPLPQGGTYCPGSAPVPLAASPPGGTFGGPGVSGAPATGFVFAPGRVGPGTYPLTYTYLLPGGLGCPGVATATAVVAPVRPLVLPPDTVLCPGSAAQIRLRATPPGGTWAGPGVSGTAGLGFVFDARALASTGSGAANGRARLTYSPPASSCAAPAGFALSTAAVPAFAPAYTAPRCPEALAAPRLISFADAASNPATRWDFGDGTPPATGPTARHAYLQPGTYRPRATLAYGPANTCTLQQLLPPVEVAAQNLPNVITPNADRLNDTFKPIFACRPRLQIFSRWGQLVYESDAYADDWAAEGQSAGLYYYVLDDHNGQRQRGWLEVVK